MMRLLCALAAIVLPAVFLLVSQSDPVRATSYGTMNADLPPERFQGDNGVVVFYTDRAGIDENCGVAEPGRVIIACHRIHKQTGASVIFMPNPCWAGRTEQYAKIACHELGHANGWSGNHEE